MKGPDLTNSLIGVLLRFRKGQIAIASDIEVLFYQIKIAPKDPDCLRYLWWPGGELSFDPEVYKMKVHLFGAKSSPPCATFCLQETAREFGKFFDPIIAETVSKNFYVDDCMVSVDSDEQGVKLVRDLRQLLQMTGFNLTKWASTCSSMMSSIPNSEKSQNLQHAMPGKSLRMGVLGISWNVSTDEFRFSVDLPEH